MQKIIIRTQAEFDALPEKFDEYTQIIIKAKLKISIIKARGNSSVVARENSSVVAWENSSVVAWENSSVEARGNSSVEAWGNSVVRIFSAIKSLAIYGFSVLFMPFDLDFLFTYEKKTCKIQKIKPLLYLEREGIKEKDKGVILFKRVSKDFKTQENTENETLWEIGNTVTHPSWNPKTSECGEGKFHACSRPYFADEFRSTSGDRYIAIQIKIVDLFEWPNATYTHKIAFREGVVLYECNKFGEEIKP